MGMEGGRKHKPCVHVAMLRLTYCYGISLLTTSRSKLDLLPVHGSWTHPMIRVIPGHCAVADWASSKEGGCT